MKQSAQKKYGSKNCIGQYLKSELRLLYRFFKCKSKNDLVRAVQKYEAFLSSRETFSFDVEAPQVTELVLGLANDLYVDFKSLEKPLQYRYPAKHNGTYPTTRNFPADILNIIQECKKKKDWAKSPTEPEIIKRLQREGTIQRDLKVSTLQKDIQDLRRRQAELENDFKDFRVEDYIESNPE